MSNMENETQSVEFDYGKWNSKCWLWWRVWLKVLGVTQSDDTDDKYDLKVFIMINDDKWGSKCWY